MRINQESFIVLICALFVLFTRGPIAKGLEADEASAETNIDQPASYLDEAAVPTQLSPITRWAQDWVLSINAARNSGRQCGSTYYNPAQPVAWNWNLYYAADRHSTDMATHNFFSHTGSDGSNPEDRVRQAGYTPSSWGENISAGDTTISAVVSAWLNSPGHCANIMNPIFREIGAAVGINPNSQYRYYWTLVLASR